MLAGGPALATAFGTFHAPNITPHAEAGIGGWSLAQFSDALSDGEGPEGISIRSFRSTAIRG